MASMKQKLKLNREEDYLLRILYRQFKVTTDNLPRLPDVLDELVRTWNNLAGRSDSAPEVLHYMMTRRKKKQWEKLGRKSQPRTDVEFARFEDDDWAHIDSIYEDLQIASDNFALDQDVGKKFADEFARRTNKIVPPMLLAAAVVRRRKGAKLTTLKPKHSDAELGFRDIDEVAS